MTLAAGPALPPRPHRPRPDHYLFFVAFFSAHAQCGVDTCAQRAVFRPWPDYSQPKLRHNYAFDICVVSNCCSKIWQVRTYRAKHFNELDLQ